MSVCAGDDRASDRDLRPLPSPVWVWVDEWHVKDPSAEWTYANASDQFHPRTHACGMCLCVRTDRLFVCARAGEGAVRHRTFVRLRRYNGGKDHSFRVWMACLPPDSVAKAKGTLHIPDAVPSPEFILSSTGIDTQLTVCGLPAVSVRRLL